MNSVFFDAPFSDDERRKRIYTGQLLVYSSRKSTRAFIEFADSLIRNAFHPYDPREAQHAIPVEQYASILAKLKPEFIHHPVCKDLIREILSDFGCDLEKTYFDVPRLRTATSGDYLKSGLAYAFHPHRDTWYSAPFCQINWWIPVYEIEPDNAMAFHPKYWSQGIKNGSANYNYYKWNEEGRKAAANQIHQDTRVQPKAEEPIELDPQVRIICNPGGVIQFSAAQLHSTVPNTSGKTRFSIDFRTVNLNDVQARNEASNVDSHPQGTTLRDFLRAPDLARIPEEIVRAYDPTPLEGVLVYTPDSTEAGR